MVGHFFEGRLDNQAKPAPTTPEILRNSRRVIVMKWSPFLKKLKNCFFSKVKNGLSKLVFRRARPHEVLVRNYAVASPFRVVWAGARSVDGSSDPEKASHLLPQDPTDTKSVVTLLKTTLLSSI